MARDRNRDELPPLPEPLPAPVTDAHTHLDACGCANAEDVATMVDRAESAGVSRVVTVADDLQAARWAVDAATADDRVFAAVGLHPTRAKDFGNDGRDTLDKLAQHPRVVSIGETGLDYYWDYSPPEPQREAFRWHIDLAKRVDKALMIHDRDAHEDIFRILQEEGAPSTVVFHCFSGDPDFARRCIDKGYVLSFSGTVSFRNAKSLHEAARIAPSAQILVETDAPFLTPHPFRGRPNEPYCAAYTTRALAELREMELAELASTLHTNAQRVFALPATRES